MAREICLSYLSLLKGRNYLFPALRQLLKIEDWYSLYAALDNVECARKSEIITGQIELPDGISAGEGIT